jgi:hypothetical protein|nr:MAG TPA: protein of unknown function (DUF4535) [Bacteriophage sp.]
MFELICFGIVLVCELLTYYFGGSPSWLIHFMIIICWGIYVIQDYNKSKYKM